MMPSARLAVGGARRGLEQAEAVRWAWVDE